MSAFGRYGDVFLSSLLTRIIKKQSVFRKHIFLPSFTLGIQYVLLSVRLHGDVFRAASLWINQKLLRMLAQSHRRICAFGQKAVSSLMQMQQQSEAASARTQTLISDSSFYFLQQLSSVIAFLTSYNVILELHFCCSLISFHLPLRKTVRQWADMQICPPYGRMGAALIVVQNCSRHCRCLTSESIPVECIWEHSGLVFFHCAFDTRRSNCQSVSRELTNYVSPKTSLVCPSGVSDAVSSQRNVIGAPPQEVAKVWFQD